MKKNYLQTRLNGINDMIRVSIESIKFTTGELNRQLAKEEPLMEEVLNLSHNISKKSTEVLQFQAEAKILKEVIQMEEI